MSAQKPARKHLYAAMFAMLTLVSCVKTDYVLPDFFKIYLQENSNDDNMFVIDAFYDTDDWVTVVAAKGNVQNRFGRYDSLAVIHLNPQGEIANRSFLGMTNYGFLSNVVKQGNKYSLVWSDYVALTKYTFSSTEMGIGTITKEDLVPSASTLQQIGEAFAVAPKIDGSGFVFFNNETDKGLLYNRFFETKLNTISYLGQYVSTYNELFPTIELIAPIVQYDAFFWVEPGKDRYYVSSPSNGKFQILEYGNNLPIYSDANYWISAHSFDDSGTMAAIIIPQHISNEEGFVYFSTKIALNKRNQSFKTLDNVHLLKNITKFRKIVIQPWEDKYFVCGTSNSGTIILQVFDSSGSLLTATEYGNTYPYELAAIRISQDKSHLAIFGTTTVGNKYQRLFFLRIPIKEILQ